MTFAGPLIRELMVLARQLPILGGGADPDFHACDK